MIAWIRSHDGFVNERRIEPFVSQQNGVGIRAKIHLFPVYNRSGHSDDVDGADPLLLRIPYKLYMHPFSELHADGTMHAIAVLYDAGLEYNSMLAVALALELRNETSLWRPYLDTLPQSLPRFGSRMNAKEIDLLRRLGNRHGLADRVEERVKIDLDAFARITRHQPALGLAAEEYLFAVALINSRCFGAQPAHFLSMRDKSDRLDANVAVLVPYLDLFNHREARRIANRYYHEWNATTDQMDMVYFATAFDAPNGSLAPGEEILNSYHVDDLSITYFLFYGFVLQTKYNLGQSVDSCRDANQCYTLESQLIDITRHLQFSESHAEKLNPVTMHAYATEVALILHDYVAHDQEANPVMTAFIQETLSLAQKALEMMHGVEDCRRI